MSTVTLQNYERAERDVTLHEARLGYVVHAAITFVVWAVLIPVNIIVAPEFPWVAFVIGGMGIGLFFHWIGYRRTETDLRRRQSMIEERAASYTA